MAHAATPVSVLSSSAGLCRQHIAWLISPVPTTLKFSQNIWKRYFLHQNINAKIGYAYRELTIVTCTPNPSSVWLIWIWRIWLAWVAYNCHLSIFSLDCLLVLISWLNRGWKTHIHFAVRSTRNKQDQAPVPLTAFRSNSKFDENSKHSSVKYTRPITTIFCTRHDSVTVVTCAKYRCDRPRTFYTRVFWNFIEFRIRSKYA